VFEIESLSICRVDEKSVNVLLLKIKVKTDKASTSAKTKRIGLFFELYRDTGFLLLELQLMQIACILGETPDKLVFAQFKYHSIIRFVCGALLCWLCKLIIRRKILRLVFFLSRALKEEKEFE
jgi:hypothetical protein